MVGATAPTPPKLGTAAEASAARSPRGGGCGNFLLKVCEHTDHKIIAAEVKARSSRPKPRDCGAEIEGEG